MPRREYNIAVSTFNYPRGSTLTKSPEWHASAAQSMDANGILGSEIANIHPRSIRAGGLLHALVDRGAVTRLHESWRSKKPSDLPGHTIKVAQDRGVKAGVLSTVTEGLLMGALPHIDDSLRRLNELQNATGKKLLVIVHPEAHVHARDGREGGSRHTSAASTFKRYGHLFPGGLHYQPTADLLAKWNIDPTAAPSRIVRGMRDAEQELGLGKPIGDLGFIGQERDGHQLADPESLIQELAVQDHIAGFQIGYRPHLAPTIATQDTEEEQADRAINGYFHETDQATWLRAGIENLPGSQAVWLDIEVPEKVMLMAGARNFVEGNRGLITQVRGLHV